MLVTISGLTADPPHGLNITRSLLTPANVVDKLKSNLQTLSLETSNPKLNLHFANSITTPKPTETEEVLDIEWLRQLKFTKPVLVCLFANLPESETNDLDFSNELLNLRSMLAQHSILLSVVVYGNEDELKTRIPFIRKQSQLSPKTGLIGLPLNADLLEFSKLILNLLTQQTQLQISNSIRSLREKRDQVAPPMDLMTADANLTIKMGFLAEMQGNIDFSLKLFENGYDTLFLMFKNKVFTGSKYLNAKFALDLLAMKICWLCLPSASAFDKFIIHLRIVDQISRVYNIKVSSKWSGFQYALFAHLVSLFKREFNNPGECCLGLLWLDAAKLLSKEQEEEEEFDFRELLEFLENKLQDGDDLMDVRACFLKSVSELSGLARAKSYALREYGRWLVSLEDETAAKLAFKSANSAFPGTFWPNVQSELYHETNDEVGMFLNGLKNDFPNDEQSSHDLFTVVGVFKQPETYVGRKAYAQVSLRPLFKQNLTLEWVKIVHSLGTLQIEHVPDAPVSKLCKDGPIQLKFADFDQMTFEFAVTSLEIGQIELEEVQFQVLNSKFTQRIPITQPADLWVSSSKNTHFKPNAQSTKIKVNVRPARIKVYENLLPVLALDEHQRYEFKLVNLEDEKIEPEISVKLITSDDEIEIFETKTAIELNGEYVIHGEFTTPPKIFDFQVEAKFQTKKDSLPVMMKFNKQIDVQRPFRVSFDLLPEYLDQPWPAVFAPSLDLPVLKRKWRLKPAILSMVQASDVRILESKVMVDCDEGDIVYDNEVKKLGVDLAFNSMTSTSHSFTCARTDNGHQQLDAKAFLELKWQRLNSETINTITLPFVKLTLPVTDPRVLVKVNRHGGDSDMSEVSYIIENPTSKVLNYSVSMASSTYFAFQGPKVMNLRVLPKSQRQLLYQLVPLGDAAVQSRRPLPELRIFDINYKRTLNIQPGADNVIFEQGTLFI